MSQGKTKVYIYTRVSTTMQIDGYSLDAQKARMKAYADFNDYQIVGEYEDAGKSGKSIEGRASFCRMMEDIKSGKDGVSYVLVFKLSRFGRNAADVLSTLQVMQDFGVNLICVEDGIDSSKDAGKLMISVLSAVAEIERENIRVQTMEGRIQKAREGRWNGGFAPYGYRLVDGVLQINEDEAPAIRTIFEQYVNTDTGANGLSKYLETHGFQKLARQNGTSPLFSATLIRAILKNPVYCGKIAFGRRKLEKIHGTRNEYHQVPQENYLLVDGLHEGIVSEELWNAAQVKLLAQSKRYEPVNRSKTEQAHLLSARATEFTEPIRHTVCAELHTADNQINNWNIPAEKLFNRLPYSHLKFISKIENPVKRAFYEMETMRGCWSARELERQIASLYYERCGLSNNKEALSALVQQQATLLQPKDIINTPVTLEFLGLNDRALVTENDLEQSILDNLQHFLLEMGHGFCFEARQKRILIDEDYFFADLVFYHRILKCHVIVELKIDKFRHEYASQLNMYLNYFKAEVMQPDDNPPIGILLCTEKGDTLVKYATAGLDPNIFVQKYMIELPTEEEIQEFISCQNY